MDMSVSERKTFLAIFSVKQSQAGALACVAVRHRLVLLISLSVQTY